MKKECVSQFRHRICRRCHKPYIERSGDINGGSIFSNHVCPSCKMKSAKDTFLSMKKRITR